MIKFKKNGDFSKVTNYLEKIRETARMGILDKYGKKGVIALKSATPVLTGKTANSWYYEIINENGSASICFYNKNIQNDVPIAIILQYGHGNGNGGWIQGRDYINPAIQPIFNEILEDLRKEVKKL